MRSAGNTELSTAANTTCTTADPAARGPPQGRHPPFSSWPKAVYAGAGSAAYLGVPTSDPRHPDILGIVQHGVVHTGGKSKIAEHGGADPQDRNVPILVVLPGPGRGHTIGAPVETTQIAPTILRLLGLDPGDLQAVQIEHTRVLPGLWHAARLSR